MAEDETKGMTAEEYAAEIERIRSTMVDKSDYEALAKDNRALANSLARGAGQRQEPPKEKKNIDELRKKAMSTDRKTNIQYWSDVLEFRDEMLEQQGFDVFVPHARGYQATDADYDKADRVADTIREIIKDVNERANGNPETFTAELRRRGGIK